MADTIQRNPASLSVEFPLEYNSRVESGNIYLSRTGKVVTINFVNIKIASDTSAWQTLCQLNSSLYPFRSLYVPLIATDYSSAYIYIGSNGAIQQSGMSPSKQYSGAVNYIVP